MSDDKIVVKNLTNEDLIETYDIMVYNMAPNEPASDKLVEYGNEIMHRIAEGDKYCSEYSKNTRIFHSLPTVKYTGPGPEPVEGHFAVFVKIDGYKYVINTDPYTCGPSNLTYDEAYNNMNELVVLLNNPDLITSRFYLVWQQDPMDYEYKDVSEIKGIFVGTTK